MALPSRPPWLRILSAALLLVACVCLVELALIAVHGGPWRYGPFHASNPRDRLIWGGLALVAWFVARSAPRTRKDWAGVAGRLVLLLASLSLSLWAAERMLRAHLRASQGFNDIERLRNEGDRKHVRVASDHALAAIVRLSANRRLIYELVPGREMKFCNRRLKINSGGMRDSREYALEKEPGTVRIVAIGDSGMFGWAAHQDEDYPAVLESNLARRAGGTAYEVLNLAVPGYNTQQEVESLAAKGLAYSPDIVVLGWCENDGDAPFFLYRRNPFDRRDVSYLYDLVFDRPRFKTLIEPRVMRGSEIDSALVDPEFLRASGADGQREALARLRDLGRAHGFHVLVFGPMRSGAVRMCEDLGIPYFNTRREIAADRYPKSYGIHIMHPRAAGHRVLAEHLERTLEERGWIPKEPHAGNPAPEDNP